MRYGSLTRAEDQQLVQILGGEEVVRAMIKASEFPFANPPKFPDLTRGQIEGLITKLGLDIAIKIASGELKVKVVDGVAMVEMVTKSFFDHTGRGIPFPGMKGIVDANRAFYLTQPTINYGAIHARLKDLFGKKLVFMSAQEFQDRCEAVLEFVRKDAQAANLLNGPHFPWIMPKMQGDLGEILDATILPVLDRAYCDQFPGRVFTNHRHNDLKGKVSVVSGARQELLVGAMAAGSTCGVYFPALQGFGIQADREFVAKMPERLILSGIEVPIVVATYPGICGRDYNTPGLDLAALQWESSGCSLGFGAFGGRASFDVRSLVACEDFAGGVSVLG